MDKTSQGWSEYWNAEGAGGEVFVQAGGRKHPALARFWATVFEDCPRGARIIDIASGAGSIYARLPRDHGYALWAADLSPAALEALAGRITGVETLACSADAIPVQDQQFDRVVSQFGIEYAGVDAFAEAARLLAPGGQLDTLVHLRNGFIDARNKLELSEARLVDATGFVDLAVALVDAAYSGDASRMRQAEEKMRPAIAEIDAGVVRCSHGVHAYLLNGFRELFDNRSQYDKADTVGWLEGMRHEVDKAVWRLSHMRDAAVSEDGVEIIRRHFERAGLVDLSFDKFFTPGNDTPIAWHIRAARLAK